MHTYHTPLDLVRDRLPERPVALEVFLEPVRRYGHRARSRKCDWTFGRPLTDQVQGRMIRVQFT